MKRKLKILIISCLLLTACNTYTHRVDYNEDKTNIQIDEQTSLFQADRKRLADLLDTSKASFPNAVNLPSGNDLGDKTWQPAKVITIDYLMIERNLQNLKDEEEVELELLISEIGKVIDAKVLKSTNPALNQSALQSSKHWEFSPAMLDGKRCKSVLTTPLLFKLNE